MPNLPSRKTFFEPRNLFGRFPDQVKGMKGTSALNWEGVEGQKEGDKAAD